LCQSPESIYEVTMLPVKLLNVDAAILFSDILIILPAMGIPVAFNPGPVVNFDISNRNAINNLTHFDPEKSLDFVL